MLTTAVPSHGLKTRSITRAPSISTFSIIGYELIERKIIELRCVPTGNMYADFLTKPRGRLALAKCRMTVGLQQTLSSDTTNATA
jgi:hypothetical protein